MKHPIMPLRHIMDEKFMLGCGGALCKVTNQAFRNQAFRRILSKSKRKPKNRIY
jgi:hypothetical protein